MSDEIKNLDESRESSSNENSPSKRVFILTSEMVKRLGLDEKIKIFKDKVKVDTSIKPVSVVQIDKDKSQLIIPKTSNEESNSDVQNKSSSNNEGSNDIKDVNSDVLPESLGNENDVEKKDKETSKKSIVHHVETLEKPLIIRRSPSKNGIVVLKSQSTGNKNEKSLPKNKLKVIGDHKKVIKPSGVRKSGELVPRKLERTVTNTGIGKINNKTKVDNDAANSSGDVIFVDVIKSNKNDSLQAFRRPTVAYRKINNRNNSKKVDESSANSNQPPGLKVIKLSTINSNASRDAILNSKDLMEHSTQELEKSLQAVSAEIEEVSSEDPNVLKNEKANLSKKKKRNPPKKKKIQVIEILDDPLTSLIPKKRGRPRKYFTRESMAKLKSLNNGELENESNEESVSSALSQNLDGQNSNEKLEDSNSSENSTILNSKRRTRASRLLENSELLNGTKQSKTSNLNGETGNCDLNEKTKISNQNNESNDKKPVLDDSKGTEKNCESNNIKGSSKIENFSETIRHKKEEVEENAVETPVKVPVVRKGRGRPRRSVLTPSTPIAKKVVTNHVNDTVNDNADDDTNNNDKNRDEDNDDHHNNNDDNEDDDDNDDDDDDDNDDDDDDDDDEDYSTRSGKRKGKKSIKITTDWYIKPDGGKKSTNRSKKKKKEVKNEEAQCGKCNEKFLKSRWSAHNLSKHNNTGWLNGSKEPNFEGNEKLWKKVLGVAIKKKKGSLICDKCNEVKRSVSGFISHYKFCGKSEEEKVKMMWICPLCKGVFMPSSVDFHERTHRLEMNEAAKKPEAVTVNDIIDGKRKRKAAEKATGKILEFTKIVRDEPPAKKCRTSKSKLDDLIEKPLSAKKLPNVWKGKWAKDIAANRPAKCRQPGCTFSANTLDEICAHFRSCNFTPQTEYVCKICKFFSKFNDIIVSHVKSVHSDKLNSEDSDFDVNELSDGSAESDHNNCEEFNEDIDNPKNDPKFDLKKSKLKLYDKLRLLTRAQFLRNADWLPPNALNITYTPTIKWTLQFELDNYKSKLFENLLPNNFNLLTNSQAQDYLPELKVSMKTKQMKNTSQNFEFVRIKIIKEENLTEEEKRDKGWKSFKLFESAVINNVPTFFVGGPIWALAWLPIPVPMCDPEINQYLAVSTHPTMENNYTISQSYKFKNIIQIWNMGHLDHVAAATPTPKLTYMVSHNNGTIWCMEWCPSGSYHHSLLRNDDIFGIGSLKRIGLLATASSDGNVHIYSLPFPEELNFNASDNNDLPIYQTDPVVTLHLNRLLSQQNKINWQCTSLSWSKLSGHNIIAAGFSNGYVALWDLISKSPLLVTKNLNTFHINPFQHFYAHGHSVTYVGIIPVKGKNFLATTSLDRCTKVWDLEDPYNPIDNVKKGAGTNGAWLTHWLNTYTSYDDALGLGHTVSYMMAVRDSSSTAFPLLPTNSTTYGLAVSDYANGICHGTLAGDVTAIFPFQMFYMKDIDKLTKKRWLVSSIELVDFGENTEGENDLKANGNNDEQTNDCKNILENYDACKDRFGIVYHDDLINYKTNLLRKINRRNPVNSETMNTVPLEQYQFTSVNRLAWNQNSWSYLWVAAGYQNGLIRIFNLKSMSVHNAVDKLLPDHTKSMMHKFNNEQS